MSGYPELIDRAVALTENLDPVSVGEREKILQVLGDYGLQFLSETNGLLERPLPEIIEAEKSTRRVMQNCQRAELFLTIGIIVDFIFAFLENLRLLIGLLPILAAFYYVEHKNTQSEQQLEALTMQRDPIEGRIGILDEVIWRLTEPHELG